MRVRLLLAALVLFACHPGTPVSPVPAASAAELRFTDPDAAWLFSVAERRGVATGWPRVGPEVLGNWIESRWCNAAVEARRCATGDFGEGRLGGAAWLSLAALHYPPRHPEAFGAVYDAADFTGDGWGVRLSWVVNGAGVATSGLRVRFWRPGAEGAPTVELGSWSLPVADSVVTLAPAGPPAAAGGLRRQELAALARSPEALRTTALSRLDALAAEVERALDAGEVVKKQPGPPVPAPRAPLSVPVPLDDDEIEAAEADARARLDAVKALVSAEAEALHAALLRVVPDGV